MRTVLLASFIAWPFYAQAKPCWIEVSRDGGRIIVEAFANPADWSEGRYSLQANISTYGNSATTIHAGNFAQGATAPPLARIQLYSGNSGGLAIKLTVRDAAGRSCEDVIAY